MNDRDKVYLAGLLHDIGKFIERAKNPEWQEKTIRYVRNKETSRGYAHRRYSALFVEEYLHGKEFLTEEDINSVSELVLHHHNDNKNEVEKYLSIDERGLLQQIIRIADDLASSEREENLSLEPEKYTLVNLESPFNDIKIKINEKDEYLDDKNKKYLIPAELSLNNSNQFPSDNKTIPSEEQSKYPNLVKNFLDKVKNIESETALLYLMEKYLSQVPAQTPVEFDGKQHLHKPDLNLYDHSRVVAAIAVVLYEEFEKGPYKNVKKQISTQDKKYLEQLSSIGNPGILICGNVNGIQDFIFDVKSKKAAKSLKGRSYFIQLLTEVVSKFIIDKWDLKEPNILYNGGGNFFILAPNYRKNSMEEIQKEISEKLIETKLYLSIGYTEITFHDFSNFGDAFDRAVKNSNKAKKKKYKKLSVEKVFEPFPQKLKGEKKYDDLTLTLQESTHYFIGKYNPNYNKKAKWEELFNLFGYQISFRKNVEIPKQGIVFNNLDFSKFYEGFRFSVKDLPVWNTELKNKFENEYLEENDKFEFDSDDNEGLDKIVSFKRLAELAKFETGTEKLGVLKMDIDNLGQIFKDGLQKPTIGRVAFLSRSLKWFFEGYMNTLLNSKKFKYHLYPIFSGGDDFFIVGAWNKIFDFALIVKEEFNRFVANHPGITLSASLLVLDEKYPVKQMARLAEERLEDAKNRRDIKTNNKIKNAVSVFDTVLSWDDFYEAKRLKGKVVEIINLTKNRAVINKIQKSSAGFASIQKDVLFNKIIRIYKVWRLNYYMRDLVNIGKNNPNKEKIESLTNEIITQYEELYFKAFKGEKTSVQIFPVAARWAELETRKKLGDKENDAK